jgi:hypothetical protein
MTGPGGGALEKQMEDKNSSVAGDLRRGSSFWREAGRFGWLVCVRAGGGAQWRWAPAVGVGRNLRIHLVLASSVQLSLSLCIIGCGVGVGRATEPGLNGTVR